MAKGDTKEPLCRHCWAKIHRQKTIDDVWEALNLDGSPHRCPGSVLEKAETRPVYQRIREDRPAVRNTDPETSHEGWDKAKPKAETLRSNIASVLLAREGTGATISEIAWALGYGEARDSISPRMSEMETRGTAIRGSGRRVPGPGLSSQTVWYHPLHAPPTEVPE